MEADIEFVAPCQREISAYVENDQPVYAYSFDYVPDGPIYEEDKKTFSLFGKDPVAIQRKELSGPGNFFLVFKKIFFCRKKVGGLPWLGSCFHLQSRI